MPLLARNAGSLVAAYPARDRARRLFFRRKRDGFL